MLKDPYIWHVKQVEMKTVVKFGARYSIKLSSVLLLLCAAPTLTCGKRFVHGVLMSFLHELTSLFTRGITYHMLHYFVDLFTAFFLPRVMHIEFHNSGGLVGISVA
jgi:hypothetical protein